MSSTPQAPVDPSTPASVSEKSPTEADDPGVLARAGEIFSERFTEHCKITDHRFCWLLLFEWLGGTVILIFLSAGQQGTAGFLIRHILQGALAASIPAIAAWQAPGQVRTRHLIAVGQMLLVALAISLSEGTGGTPLFLLASLAFLSVYRDWKVLATATVTAIVCQGYIVWSTPEATSENLWESINYFGWMLFADTFLFFSIDSAVSEIQRAAAEQSRLEWKTAGLTSQKEDSDAILAHVPHGLFLLNRDFKIGGLYSKSLEHILATSDLEHRDFLQLIRRSIPDQVHRQVREYLKQMFDPNRKDIQTSKSNPMAEIEFAEAAPVGGVYSKHLQFDFQRVVSGEEITHLLVSVNDVAERVRLNQNLRNAERKQQRQLELLTGILHVEPDSLREFISSSLRSLRDMTAALRDVDFADNAPDTKSPHGTLETLIELIRPISANAELLHLPYFQSKCSQIEEKIAGLRNSTTLAANDFLPVAIAQSELSTAFEDTEYLLEKLAGLRRTSSEPSGGDSITMLRSIAAKVQMMAADFGKDVVFSCKEFEHIDVPAKYRELFQDIVVQLSHNSLAYGIEGMDERENRNKSRTGTVQLLPATDTSGTFEFIVRDDGRGLSPLRLQNRAVEMGIVSLEQVSSWEPGQLAALIFEPGFHTLEEEARSGTGGIGMPLVKTRVVDESGGEIRINSTPGQFCEFHVILPA